MLKSHASRRLRRPAALAAVAAATLLAGAGGPGAAASNHATGHAYLALGDSVVFGYITQAGFEYGNPDNFVGYPDYAGRDLRLDVTNASCPGEATTGFLSSTGADNGCRTFRAHAPLHVSYSGTQMDFATAFLRGHPNTRLVTVALGANDLFILQNSCGGSAACIQSGLPAVLGTIAADMDTILGNLRATGYHGVIEVVNYYSLDYTDAAGTAITQLLNQAETASAAAHGAVVADAFDAMKDAASPAGGRTCMAGLLNASPANQFTCDVHPSQSGQQTLAAAVEAAWAAATADEG